MYEQLQEKLHDKLYEKLHEKVHKKFLAAMFLEEINRNNHKGHGRVGWIKKERLTFEMKHLTKMK